LDASKLEEKKRKAREVEELYVWIKRGEREINAKSSRGQGFVREKVEVKRGEKESIGRPTPFIPLFPPSHFSHVILTLSLSLS
jgi:hypothetical protein